MSNWSLLLQRDRSLWPSRQWALQHAWHWTSTWELIDDPQTGSRKCTEGRKVLVTPSLLPVIHLFLIHPKQPTNLIFKWLRFMRDLSHTKCKSSKSHTTSYNCKKKFLFNNKDIFIRKGKSDRKQNKSLDILILSADRTSTSSVIGDVQGCRCQTWVSLKVQISEG